MTRRNAALLVALGAVWGAVYPLTSLALRELEPPAVVVARTALGAAVLLPLAAHQRVLGWFRARPGGLLVAALLQATIPLVLLTTGQQHVPAGLAGILVGTQPVWAGTLTTTAERTVQPREVAGLLLGLAGVVLLFARDLTLSDTAATAGAGALVLAAAFFYGAGTVYIQRRLPEVPPLATATAAMSVSAVALAPFTLATARPAPDVATAAWLVALGVVGTGVALVWFYGLIQRVGAVRANLAAYLAPGFAVVYDAAFLHGPLTTTMLGGLVLVTAGSLLVGTPKALEPSQR